MYFVLIGIVALLAGLLVGAIVSRAVAPAKVVEKPVERVVEKTVEKTVEVPTVLDLEVSPDDIDGACRAWGIKTGHSIDGDVMNIFAAGVNCALDGYKKLKEKNA